MHYVRQPNKAFSCSVPFLHPSRTPWGMKWRNLLVAQRIPPALGGRRSRRVGRLVKEIESGVRGPGAYFTSWDGRTSAGARAPSGTYFLKLQADDHSEARAVTLIR